ncbi:hypothetical protein PRIPAC_96353, partial [Pristionchus pacificus]|uniref:Uncharacterized protein n=1 Tax=Pristionchus pacificus TaxID=54126 RepID=A0A2A6BCA5_PRIPA
MNDGYEEANNLLSATLEQLDDILQHGHRINNEKRSGIHSTSSSIPPLLTTKNNPFRIMEMKRLETDENGNGKENRDGCWEGNVWSDQGRRDSSVSSGAESPPTDLPTSSASSTALCNPFELFVK